MNSNDFLYYGFKFVEKIVGILPKKFLINFLGTLGYFLDKKRKNDICVNLNFAFPEKSNKWKQEVAKKIYKNFIRNLIEFVENKRISKEKLLEKIEFEGFDDLNYPAIFVTAHFGNWEILPLAIGAKYVKLNGVYRKIDNERLNEEVIQSRERFNVHMFEKKGALRHLIRVLKNSESVGLLIDQNTAKRDGIETTFFGHRVLQTSSSALLSKKLNIPIVIAFAVWENDKWKIIVKDVFYTDDIQESVDRQSRVIEEMVKEYPDEYYWFHKRFKHFYEEEYDKHCNFN